MYRLQFTKTCADVISVLRISTNLAERCHKRQPNKYFPCPCGAIFDCPFDDKRCGDIESADWRKLFKEVLVCKGA